MRYKQAGPRPVDGRSHLVIIDENFSLHPEASSYLLVLADGRKLSINTVRAYAGRVARFLGWADRRGVVWKTITLTEMTLGRGVTYRAAKDLFEGVFRYDRVGNAA